MACEAQSYLGDLTCSKKKIVFLFFFAHLAPVGT